MEICGVGGGSDAQQTKHGCTDSSVSQAYFCYLLTCLLCHCLCHSINCKFALSTLSLYCSIKVSSALPDPKSQRREAMNLAFGLTQLVPYPLLEPIKWSLLIHIQSFWLYWRHKLCQKLVRAHNEKSFQKALFAPVSHIWKNVGVFCKISCCMMRAPSFWEQLLDLQSGGTVHACQNKPNWNNNASGLE